MFLLRLEDVDMAEGENRDSAWWLLGRCRGEACWSVKCQFGPVIGHCVLESPCHLLPISGPVCATLIIVTVTVTVTCSLTLLR